MRVFIKPYNKSNSAFKLCRSLGINRIMPVPTKYSHDILAHNYQYQDGDIIINWGAGSRPYGIPMEAVINHEENCRKVINKRRTLQILEAGNIPTLEWTDSKEEAKAWARGYRIFCRKLLESNSGKGIVVAESPDEVVDAKIYTKGVNVEREFRVHIMDGECIDLTAKCLRKGREKTAVQNWDNGYIFARNAVPISDELRADLEALAVRTVEHFGLVFAAIDIIRTEEGKLLICELNTAPGIEGTTVERYSNAFRNLVTKLAMEG